MSPQVPRYIENDADAILQTLSRESIDVYRFLSERFITFDPKDDAVFQFVFRSFYRLDNAGLTPEFKERFFNFPAQQKTADRRTWRLSSMNCVESGI